MTSWQIVRIAAGTFILLSLALGIPGRRTRYVFRQRARHWQPANAAALAAQGTTSSPPSPEKRG